MKKYCENTASRLNAAWVSFAPRAERSAEEGCQKRVSAQRNCSCRVVNSVFLGQLAQPQIVRKRLWKASLVIGKDALHQGLILHLPTLFYAAQKRDCPFWSPVTRERRSSRCWEAEAEGFGWGCAQILKRTCSCTVLLAH